MACHYQRAIGAIMVARFFLFFFLLMILACPTFAADHPLINLLPQDPLIAVSWCEFSKTYETAMGLEAVKRHAQSKDKERFDKSKLALKLKARINDFSKFIGHDISIDDLKQLAGPHLAIGLYDIGELRFILLSDLDYTSQAALSYLTEYESLPTRKVGDRTYFVKDDPKKGLSFAIYKNEDFLAISNDISLIETTLSNLSKTESSQAFRQNTKWSYATKALPSLASRDSILFMDTERLKEDSYFRYYWVYNNRSEFSDYMAVVSGINLGENNLDEQRVVLGDFKKSEGRAMRLKSDKGAIVGTTNSDRFSMKDVSDFFSWPMEEIPQWEKGITGAIYFTSTHKDENGIIRFHKGAVFAADHTISLKEMAGAISRGATAKLLIVPDDFGFKDGPKGRLDLTPLPGFSGAYLAKDENAIFVANDPGTLEYLKEHFVPENDPKLRESIFIDLKNELPNWADGFSQMGPQAAFDQYAVGAFFAFELSGLLSSISAFETFRFESSKEGDALLIQKVEYGW